MAKKRPVEHVEGFDPYDGIDNVLDGIEKDFGLLSSSLDTTERRLSTGLLTLDLVVGKGLVAGGWYTITGPESSAKSTAASTMLAQNLNSEVPIISMWDYEGSTEPNYLENILKIQNIKTPIDEIFGVRDPNTNKYVVKPRIRLYFESIAERFFDYLSKLERVLPDKVKIGDNYYFVYPNTKPNQEMLKGQYDPGFFKKYNKFRVMAPNGLPQAFVIADSYPAMLPEGQDVDDPSAAMAIQARMFSDQMKRVKGKLRSKRITVVGMNQLRDRPAVMYGSPQYEPCGNAVKFYCMVGDTLLFTTEGIQTAQDTVNIECSIFGKESVERPNIHMKALGPKRTIAVVTEHGYRLEGARSHQVWATWHTVDRTGWFTLERVCYGDYSVSIVGGQDLWSRHAPKLVADGRTVEMTEAQAFELGRDHKGNAGTLAPKLGVNEECLSGIGVSRNGLNKGLFATMAAASRPLALAFLKGLLLTGDEVRPTVVLQTEKARQYVQMMLLNLGVVTRVKESNAAASAFTLAVVDTKALALVLDGHAVHRRQMWDRINPDMTVENVDVQTFDANMPSSHIVTGGILSHNSDCRIQVTARSNIYGKGMIDEEPSYDGEGTDRYRYIHARTIKNKLGTPYLEGMMRVWISDKDGKARGFDPVFDTFQYLTMTGQLKGNRKALKFVGPGMGALSEARPVKWGEFKTLILGTKQEKIELQKSIGVSKPFDLRPYCKKQLAEGNGTALFFESLRNKSRADSQDED